MIKILEDYRELKEGEVYDVNTDSGKAVLKGMNSDKIIKLTYELIRKVPHEYIPNDYAM